VAGAVDIHEAVLRLRALAPTGRTLPDAAWLRRHHAMVGLLVAEAFGLAVFSLAQGNSWLHSLLHPAGLIPIAGAALALEHRRRVAAVLVSLGLITACALLVHTWEGAIEAHFLFFVTIVVLALYEDWVPFLVAAAYVVVHHGAMGALDPSAVYNHPDAIAHPWKWAMIHGGFVVAAGLASVAAWRLNEAVRAQAHESEQRFRSAFHGAPIGMALFTFGEARSVTQVNEAMSDITGYSRERLTHGSLGDLVHPEDKPIVQHGLDRLASGTEERPQFEIRLVHADGHDVWVWVSLSLLRGEPGGPGYAIAQLQDVTERKRASEELAVLALHDPLTGLGNRRSLLADLTARLDRATDESPLLLVLFDLDGFKNYNDTFGHPAGDALLERMAGRLERNLQGLATAYRMGGDEFCVLSLLNCPDPSAIRELAAEALTEQGEGFLVSASHGSVRLPDEATTPTEALREADRRMYARKSSSSRSSAGRQSADVLLSILSERSSTLGINLDELTGLCESVAHRLGLPDDERAPLLQAASLHDVGKVAIPDEILNKPGELSEDEWDFMRRHTEIGERILAAAPALIAASRLVRSTHEHFDGSGYPDGLAGEQIPLGSRVIAVCDAYVAMISARPYRGAMDWARALAELRRCAGTQFDPRVVEVVAEVLIERSRLATAVIEA
jgi:diguanylate cyclase (GGDEF)-like protein/PAS domain S-box-containing protein